MCTIIIDVVYRACPYVAWGARCTCKKDLVRARSRWPYLALRSCAKDSTKRMKDSSVPLLPGLHHTLVIVVERGGRSRGAERRRTYAPCPKGMKEAKVKSLGGGIHQRTSAFSRKHRMAEKIRLLARLGRAGLGKRQKENKSVSN